MKRLIWVGSLVLILVFLCSYAVLADNDYAGNKVQVGVGTGIPYGGLIGGQFELSPTDYLAITLGFGGNQGGVSPAGGVRVYLNGKDSEIRPRLGYYWGTVCQVEDGFLQYKNIHGTAVGAGFTWRVGRRVSMDFDVLNICSFDSDISTYKREDDSNLTFSFGVGFHIK